MGEWQAFLDRVAETIRFERGHKDDAESVNQRWQAAMDSIYDDNGCDSRNEREGE